MVLRIAMIGLLLVVSMGTTMAAEPAVPEALARKLAEFPGAERGKVIPVEDNFIARVFPGYAFYVLRFLQYPAARVPPARLSANNLFVAKPDGSVDVLRDAAGLETFFRAMLAPMRTEGDAKDAVVAWLRLTQEFRQDGFFQFLIGPDTVRVAKLGVQSAPPYVLSSLMSHDDDLAARIDRLLREPVYAERPLKPLAAIPCNTALMLGWVAGTVLLWPGSLSGVHRLLERLVQ